MALALWGRRAAPSPRIEPALPALPAADRLRERPSAVYMRPEMGTPFRGWMPVLRDAKDDVRAAWWRAAARTIDSIQNSGWLAGAVEKSIGSMIGDGLRLAAKPDPELFGGDQAGANSWARLVERRFEAWGNSPAEVDAEGKQTLSQLEETAVRSYFATGEVTGLVPWIDRPGAMTRTKIRLLPPHRLTQETNGIDLWQGVRVDRHGRPISYRFRLTQPLLQIGEVKEVAARDGTGRPRAIHIFSGEVGTYRGISPLTPVLKIVRQFDKLQDLTLTSAMIHAIFAATVKSPAPTPDILAAIQNNAQQGVGGDFDGWTERRMGWYADAPIDLDGPSGVTHLYTGEELDLNRSEAPNATYEPFAKMLSREIASCLAIGYTTLTGDYSEDTYSSTRMRTAELWPVTLRRRKNYPGTLCQIAYGCWLEEEIDAGAIPFPGGTDNFAANRTAACMGDWRGPAKPQADDLKHAKAVQTLYMLGLLTAEQVCADLGSDWEAVFEQLKREADKRKELGIPDPMNAPDDPSTDRLDAEPDGGGGEQGAGEQ